MEIISRKQFNCPRCQSPLELVTEKWRCKTIIRYTEPPWEAPWGVTDHRVGSESFFAKVLYCSKRCGGYELVLDDPWDWEPLAVELEKQFPQFGKRGPYTYKIHGTLNDIFTRMEYYDKKVSGADISEETLRTLKEHLGKNVEIGYETYELDEYDEGVTTGGRIYKRLHFEYKTARPTLISICGDPIFHSGTSIEYIKSQEKILFERYKGAAGSHL